MSKKSKGSSIPVVTSPHKIMSQKQEVIPDRIVPPNAFDITVSGFNSFDERFKLYTAIYAIGYPDDKDGRLINYRKILELLGDPNFETAFFGQGDDAINRLIEKYNRPDANNYHEQTMYGLYHDWKKDGIIKSTKGALSPAEYEFFIVDKTPSADEPFINFIDRYDTVKKLILNPDYWGGTKKESVKKNFWDNVANYFTKLDGITYSAFRGRSSADELHVTARKEIYSFMWSVPLEIRLKNRDKIETWMNYGGNDSQGYFEGEVPPERLGLQDLPRESGSLSSPASPSSSQEVSLEISPSLAVPIISSPPSSTPIPISTRPEMMSSSYSRQSKTFLGSFFPSSYKMDGPLQFFVSKSKDPFVPGSRPESRKLRPHFSLISADLKDALNTDTKCFCIFLWADYVRVIFMGSRGTNPLFFINSRPASIDQFKECLLKNRRILATKAESADDLNALKAAESFCKIVEKVVPSYQRAIEGLELSMKEAARNGDSSRMAKLAKDMERLTANRRYFEDKSDKLQRESDIVPEDEQYTSDSGKKYAYQKLLRQEDFARILQAQNCDSVLVRDAMNSLANIRMTEICNKILYYSTHDCDAEYSDEDRLLYESVRGISKPRRYCKSTEVGADFIIRAKQEPNPVNFEMVSTAPPTAYVTPNPNMTMVTSGGMTTAALDFNAANRAAAMPATPFTHVAGELRHLPDAGYNAVSAKEIALQAAIRDQGLASGKDEENAAKEKVAKAIKELNEARAEHKLSEVGFQGSSSSSAQ